jgi:hypothetical protein
VPRRQNTQPDVPLRAAYSTVDGNLRSYARAVC